MYTVKDIYEKLTDFAPLELKMDFDNPGFLVGFSDAVVNNILVSLDITEAVINEASSFGAQLIVSHHPLFFSLKNVTGDGEGRRAALLLSRGIAAVCMHTNLDAAEGGVNDLLAEAASLAEIEHLTEDGRLADGETYCIGRIGRLAAPLPLTEYLPILCRSLKANGLRYVDSGKPAHRVAVVGGSGGNLLETVYAKGCDTYITADVKYDTFLEAKRLGLSLIDGGHFCTENVVVPKLHTLLSLNFPGVSVKISECHAQAEQYYTP